MSSSWFLARRLLLWRQERRRLNRSAVIAVVGVAIGSAVLILSLSILNGFEAEVHDDLMRFEHQRVLLPRSSKADIETAAAALATAGISTRPYAERKLVVQSEADYRLVTARIVPDLTKHQAAFGESVIQQLPYRPLGHGVIIGSLLADRLGLLPGDEVRLISPLDISLADPRPPQLKVSVQAIYEFGILDFDDAYLFTDFPAAEKLVPRLAAYSGLSIEGIDNNWTERSLEILDGEKWELRTWETGHTDLLTAMKMEKLGSTVVLFLIILVASFNATSTMVMSVMEKYREIGILRSMGATGQFIRALFLRQGLLIGVVGVGVGVSFGVAVSLGQAAYHFIPGPQGLYAEGGLPMDLRWLDVLVVIVGALAMSLGAAWYPARTASSIAPGQAVNYEK
ncbi:MAG: ABC transporter permease [Fidelibacterota bacterium]|nr:MAG: ABC transporter permease [Candidatus Neomarinimicrobiota bacterium]